MLSRAGSMRFLIEVLTRRAGLPDVMVDRALTVTKHHLPIDEPAYAPFWEALTSDEGEWV